MRELEFRTDGTGLTMGIFQEFLPELLEDDERVFGGDPLRRFTLLEEITDDVPDTWCAGNWAKRARPR